MTGSSLDPILENVNTPLLSRALFFSGIVLLAIAAPAVAVFLAWPFLVFVPGWLLVSRVAPGISAPGRIGLGVVVSVYGASHLVNVLASIAGFGRSTVLLTTGILVVLSLILATRRLPLLAPPSTYSMAGLRATLHTERVPLLLGAGAALLVLAVLGLSAWHQTPNGWVSGGWNWSDFLVHVAIGQSIVAGNFPPVVPYFAGAPLTYHWFADFHGAILAIAAGLDVIGVFIVSSAALAGALALLVWELARTLTGNRRLAAIAVILAIGGGGLGWIRLIGDTIAGAGDPLTLLTQNPYDNTWTQGWPYFRIPSVLGTALLPHRASTFGLPGVLAAVLLVRASLRTRPVGILTAGVIAALLAPFQFYYFPATYIIVGLLVLFTGAWRSPTARRDALLFLAPLTLALPFVLGPIATQQSHGAFKFVLGWSQAPLDDGPGAITFFYATNLGLPAFLALGAVLARRLDASVRAFLVAWALAMAIIPNVALLSSIEFDMNKYFQLGAIATAILAAALIVRWPKALIAGALAFAALAPAAIAVWHVTSSTVALSDANERAGRWIAANTPERSVFVTDAFINSPVDLAGRLRLSTFGPYVSNLGYDASQREADIDAIYCEGPDTARILMARYGAGYVLSSGGVIECVDGVEPTDFASSPLFVELFRDGPVVIWAAR